MLLRQSVNGEKKTTEDDDDDDDDGDVDGDVNTDADDENREVKEGGKGS